MVVVVDLEHNVPGGWILEAAGHKLVNVHLHCYLLILTGLLVIYDCLKAGLEKLFLLLTCSICQIFIKIYPEDTVHMGRAAHLEFQAITPVLDMHWATIVHDDMLDKHLESMVEVSGACQNIFP